VRLFLDANVLFAAVISPGGRAQALFTLAEAGYTTLLTSSFATEEARRNVARKYPTALERLETLLDQCQVVPEGSAAQVAWASDHLPAKDAPILAAAVAARAALLVTGDRAHFGELYGRTLEGTEVVSLAEALARLLAE
jgi:predicted nucleic acid-binding protein